MANILKNKKNMPKKSRDDHAEDALYREVWEEVNTQKLYGFLKKYTKHLLAVSAIIVVAVTSFQISKYNHKKNMIEISNQYHMAKNADQLQKLGTENATGDLAALKRYSMTKDVSILEDLAKNGSCRDFRDLAKINLAGIKGDKMSAAEFEKFMKSMDTKKSPFYYKASLMVAQKHLSVGDKKRARKFLDKIDKNAPNIISATAQTLRQ